MSNTNKDNRAINLQAAIDAIMDLRIVRMGGSNSGYGLVNSALEAYRAGVISALRRLPEVHVWGGDTNRSKSILMRYISPNGSATLHHGEVYSVQMWSEQSYLWVQVGDHRIPYASPDMLAKYWQHPADKFCNNTADAPNVCKVKLHRLFE